MVQVMPYIVKRMAQEALPVYSGTGWNVTADTLALGLAYLERGYSPELYCCILDSPYYGVQAHRVPDGARLLSALYKAPDGTWQAFTADIDTGYIRHFDPGPSRTARMHQSQAAVRGELALTPWLGPQVLFVDESILAVDNGCGLNVSMSGLACLTWLEVCLRGLNPYGLPKHLSYAPPIQFCPIICDLNDLDNPEPDYDVPHQALTWYHVWESRFKRMQQTGKLGPDENTEGVI